MRQLVGQSCVLCLGRIGSDFEARYCPTCGCPVHTVCPSRAQPDESDCAACGAPAAAVLSSRRVAEQLLEQRNNSRSMKEAASIVICGGLIAVTTLYFFARVSLRESVGPGTVVLTAVAALGGFAVLAYSLIRLGRKRR